MTHQLMRAIGIASIAVCLTSGAVGAQIVVHVTDAPTGNPLPLAAVQSLDAGGRVLETQSSGNDGRVTLQNFPDIRIVRVTALGYVTGTAEIRGNRSYGARTVSVPLTPDAFELDSVTVEVEGGVVLPGRLQFTQRRDAQSGIFLDPFDVGLKSKYGVVHVFAELDGVRRVRWGGAKLMPTIVTSLGTGCVRYRLNNLRVRNSSWNAWPLGSLLPQDVMAVEVYRYFGEVPEHMRKDAYPPEATHPCGLVVIWTKEAW
jgi:hypothetical protein